MALSKALGKTDFVQELQEINELKSVSAASRVKLLRLAKKTGLVTARAGRGGGTWLHPKMAVVFARWLDVDFAVWCDLQIDAILRGNLDAREQYAAATQALEDRRELASEQGKGLAAWRWRKGPLEQRADYWRDQLQMALPLKH